MAWTLEALSQALCHREPEVQLCHPGLSGSLVQDVAVDEG